jgi:hypothetical protein
VIEWTSPTDASVKFDLQHIGFRIFRFKDGPPKTAEDVINAFDLFYGTIVNRPGSPIPKWQVQDNLQFMEDMMDYVMEPRTTNLISIPKNYVKSGDMLAIIRLDGLDPLLAVLMGSQTGHTAIAMWDGEGQDAELYVHEATVNSNYWPTNGIQRTQWDTWIKQAHKANYNVALLPLSKEARSKFNATNALNFFKKTEGLLYGYQNMIFGQIDTATENLPFPASLELGQILIPLIMKKIGQSYYSDMLTQGLNNRLFGTTKRNLTTWECYAESYKRNMTISEFVTQPELDSWTYDFPNNRTGPSMVCDVFVCKMWVEGGIFGNITFNCGEFTNLDIYSLKIFDTTTPRPSECITADPQLEYCQLMGAYRMHLHHYNEYVF